MKNAPLKCSGVSDQRIGDELYLYAADGETLTVLNTTAMQIWTLCDGAHSEDDILDTLHAVYPDVETGSLREDLAACLNGFQEKCLID